MKNVIYNNNNENEQGKKMRTENVSLLCGHNPILGM